MNSTHYVTGRELAELTGWGQNTVRLRCRKANVPTIKRKDAKQRVYYFFKRDKAFAELHTPDTASTYIVPDGYISLPDLAELAECSKDVAHARLKRAGVEGKLVPRQTKAGGKQGGRKMYIFPQKEALEAVLQ